MRLGRLHWGDVLLTGGKAKCSARLLRVVVRRRVGGLSGSVARSRSLLTLRSCMGRCHADWDPTNVSGGLSAPSATVEKL